MENFVVGKNIFTTLMFTLYPDASVLFREYVQNGYDSIRNAVNQGVLDSIRDGIVSIRIETDSIIIRDNGTGIPSEDAQKRLINIFESSKNGQDNAGKFGIGRLSGGNYCSKLQFVTSAKGEDKKVSVTYDTSAIRSIVDDNSDTSSANDVVEKCVTVDTSEEESSEHYFEVRLINLQNNDGKFTQKSIVDYLSEVAPVAFNDLFYNLKINPSFKNYTPNLFEQRFNELGCINLYVNDEKIEKKYPLKTGKEDDIANIEFFELKSSEYGELGWGWYSLSQMSGMLPDTDNLRGIRLRIQNIRIGDNDFFKKPILPEERSNSYTYGEIFVTNPNICPTTDRSSLADNKEKQALEQELRMFFNKLKNLYTTASNLRSAIKSIKDAKEKLNSERIYNSRIIDLKESKGTKVVDGIKSRASDATLRLFKLFEDEYNTACVEFDKVLDSLNSAPANHQGSSISTESETVKGLESWTVKRPALGTVKGTKSGTVKGYESGTVKGSESGTVKGSESGLEKGPKSEIYTIPESEHLIINFNDLLTLTPAEREIVKRVFSQIEKTSVEAKLRQEIWKNIVSEFK